MKNPLLNIKNKKDVFILFNMDNILHKNIYNRIQTYFSKSKIDLLKQIIYLFIFYKNINALPCINIVKLCLLYDIYSIIYTILVT